MPKKISRSDSLKLYDALPLSWYDNKNDEFMEKFPKTFSSVVLTTEFSTFKGQIAEISKGLGKLFQNLGSAEIIVMGDSSIPWLKQNNLHPPVAKAISYLQDLKLGQRFNGALVVRMDEFREFFRHLAWLTRCNASLPYFHFIDTKRIILGHLCKYGNIHLYLLDEFNKVKYEEAIVSSELILEKENNCRERFSKSGAIKGRRIIL